MRKIVSILSAVMMLAVMAACMVRADTMSNAPGAGGFSPGGVNGNVQYNNAGAFGGYTNTQLTTHINAFTSTLSGAAPLSGGGTANFLRADATWATPPGTNVGSNNNTPVTSGLAPIASPLFVMPPTGILPPIPYAYGSNRGAFKEYTSLVGDPVGAEIRICAGDDGNAYLTEGTSKKLAQISPSGTLLNEFATTYNVGGLACDGKGNIWYVSGRNIASVAESTGTETTYANIFPASANPLVLCMGPDGNLWVADRGLDNLYKVTTSGVLSATYACTAGSSPSFGICAGPDGKLWFTEDGNAKLGTIKTDGTGYTEYAILSGGANGICVGADNLLYATDASSNVRQVSLAGVVLKNMASPSGTNGQICAASDGNIYTVNPGNTAYRKITLDGRLTNVNAGTNGFGGICALPNGSLLIQENTGHSFGIIDLQMTTGARANQAPITTLAGSTSGNAYWSMPEQGASCKKVIINMSSFNDAGQDVTFPTAFTYTPVLVANSTGLVIVTLNTTKITIPATGGAATGTLVIEGF